MTRHRPHSRRSTSRPALVWGTVLFLATTAGVGAVGMWPIYADPWFGVVAASGIALSIGIALVSLARRWLWWRTALAMTLAYVLVGVPLAVPSVLADPSQLPTALLAVVSAPVTGPKDLLTLELPLGTYQATLAPAFLTLLVAPGAAVITGVARGPWWAAAAPIALVPAAFGIVFGPTSASAGLASAGLAIAGAREILLGISATALVLLWMLWRSIWLRRAALREAGGVRQRAARRAAIGRAGLAAGMLAVAVVVALTATPLLTAAHARTVPRSATEPVLRIAQETSPLATYRTMFTSDIYDSVLFSVTAAGVDRVRLATMSFYDGQMARVTDPSAATTDQATAFARIPSTSAFGAGQTVRADVEIGEYSALWVPTVAILASIAFEGPERAALADGFFYSAATATGIDTSDAYGEGTRYSILAELPAAVPLTEATPPRSAPTLDEMVVPESLLSWVRLQNAGGSGAGLAELIDRLRSRGYLSHALEEPAAGAAWISELGDYTFAPSRAGHSTDRIEGLFTSLLERQVSRPEASNAELVAAVGDDEQFAVAAAMIADQLGFPVRVVLGARLQASDDASIPPCEDGRCRGKNIAAWIEVQDVSGTWIPVDVTPQWANPLDATLDQRRDPENATDLDSERAEVVPPPDADPADTDPRTTDDQETPADLSTLWLVLRISGGILLILAVLLGPLAAIIAAKALRRRRRRRAADPAVAIAGGWDEWVDATVDRGGDGPGTRTRFESAQRAGGTDDAIALATLADRASFAWEAPGAGDAEQAWGLVERERQRMDADAPLRSRLGAALSLRSLRRLRTPRDGGSR